MYEVKFLHVCLRFDLTPVSLTVHDMPHKRDRLEAGGLYYQSYQLNTKSKDNSSTTTIMQGYIFNDTP